jgi:hypothetical protein
VNHLDIAPQHASVLMGLSNTVATLPGIISPVITGYIVQNKVGLSFENGIIHIQMLNKAEWLTLVCSQNM